jgi:hypothetical protein
MIGLDGVVFVLLAEMPWRTDRAPGTARSAGPSAATATNSPGNRWPAGAGEIARDVITTSVSRGFGRELTMVWCDASRRAAEAPAGVRADGPASRALSGVSRCCRATPRPVLPSKRSCTCAVGKDAQHPRDADDRDHRLGAIVTQGLQGEQAKDDRGEATRPAPPSTARTRARGRSSTAHRRARHQPQPPTHPPGGHPATRGRGHATPVPPRRRRPARMLCSSSRRSRIPS